MSCYIGIDLGTSAVKVIAVDQTGRVLALGERRYPILHPFPGYAEQSPKDWWRSTTECIRTAFEAAQVTADSVRSIGLSGQMHGLVVLDRSGEPVRDAIIWPDTRTAEICEEWSRAGIGERFHAVTGLPIATGFFAPSLEWVRRKEPHLYEEAATVVLPKDFIRFKLTGKLATDPSDASGTYLFDITRRAWSAPIVETLRLNERLLPLLRETLQPAGELTSAAASETGLAAGTPVAVGGSDQAMAALALGVSSGGQVAVAISTGGTLVTPVTEPLVDRRLHTLCHASTDRWLLMGATLSAGAALSWLNDNVLSTGSRRGESENRIPMEELSAMASEVPSGSNGLFFLPYLSGERTPHMNPDARGSFVGLSLYHTRAHLVRAIMEGVAYSLLDSVNIFEELGTPVREILCYAGGSKSATWRQIIADVLAHPVRWRRFSDYSALGAALGGATAVGSSFPIETSNSAASDVCAPRTEEVERYHARRATFKHLYAELEPIFGEIATFRD